MKKKRKLERISITTKGSSKYWWRIQDCNTYNPFKAEKVAKATTKTEPWQARTTPTAIFTVNKIRLAIQAFKIKGRFGSARVGKNPPFEFTESTRIPHSVEADWRQQSAVLEDWYDQLCSIYHENCIDSINCLPTGQEFFQQMEIIEGSAGKFPNYICIKDSLAPISICMENQDDIILRKSNSGYCMSLMMMIPLRLYWMILLMMNIFRV